MFGKVTKPTFKLKTTNCGEIICVCLDSKAGLISVNLAKSADILTYAKSQARAFKKQLGIFNWFQLDIVGKFPSCVLDQLGKFTTDSSWHQPFPTGINCFQLDQLGTHFPVVRELVAKVQLQLDS